MIEHFIQAYNTHTHIFYPSIALQCVYNNKHIQTWIRIISKFGISFFKLCTASPFSRIDIK